MSERDQELGEALARLPVPEPPEQFWEALHVRCIEAFNSEASPGDDGAWRSRPDGIRRNGRSGSASALPAAYEGGPIHIELPQPAGSPPVNGRKLRRPRLRRHQATRPPSDPAARPRRRPSRGLLPGAQRVLTVSIAAIAVTLAGSLLTGVVDRAEAVSVVPLSGECGRDGNTPGRHGQRLVVAGVWQQGAAEQANLVKVLNAFQKDFGAGVIFAYVQTFRDMAPGLDERIANGCPPDVALLPQLGLLKDLAREHKLRPLTDRTAQRVRQNYTETWRDLTTVDGELYGVWFKATNKSLIWHGPEEFWRADPPRTWDDLKEAAARIHDQGRVAPFSVAGADGWTLTDWFENVYLATAGPEMYDRLANQAAPDAIPWTDPSVKQALTRLAEIFGRPEWLAGGTQGALQKSYEASVEDVLGSSPQAAMVYEGDFVAGSAHDVGKGLAAVSITPRSFDFPAIDGVRPLIVGGDVAVSLTNNEAGRQLMEFLASPKAAEVWAREGGFLSPNKNLDPRVYPDDATRKRAEALTQNPTWRFDLSDVQPSGFGGVTGMWLVFQDFLSRPADVDRIAETLQEKARRAWAPWLPPGPSPPSATTVKQKGRGAARR